jgi:hypothetical protein
MDKSRPFSTQDHAGHKAGGVNHLAGLYRSECCGVEQSLPGNVKFPTCPGRGKSGESRCSGQNAEWILVRPI